MPAEISRRRLFGLMAGAAAAPLLPFDAAPAGLLDRVDVLSPASLPQYWVKIGQRIFFLPDPPDHQWSHLENPDAWEVRHAG